MELYVRPKFRLLLQQQFFRFVVWDKITVYISGTLYWELNLKIKQTGAAR